MKVLGAVVAGFLRAGRPRPRRHPPPAVHPGGGVRDHLPVAHAADAHRRTWCRSRSSPSPRSAAVVSASSRSKQGCPWLLAVLCGALVAVPVGALLAIPGIRRAGIYLALATFGFAILVERLLLPSALMYGGAVGALPAPRPALRVRRTAATTTSWWPSPSWRSWWSASSSAPVSGGCCARWPTRRRR